MAPEAGFLGTGWSFPPSFSFGGADVHMVSGAGDIEQGLAILLATQPGERVMLEDFGGDLSEFVFSAMSQGLIGRVRDAVSEAILHHEPRISLNGVEVMEDQPGSGVLLITIDYTVRATNSRYNMVYPFCLDEATSAA